jgi:U3 small nucleolar RNA-associated protein 20
LLVELLKKSPYFVKHSDEQLQLLDNDFIPVVQRAIKSSNENIRHEAVQLLSTLVDNFADEIEVLRPLKQLRDVEKSDACFFENVAHLQIHRRQRAFIRLSQGLESKEVLI